MFFQALKTGSIICELHEPATSKEFRTEVIIQKFRKENNIFNEI